MNRILLFSKTLTLAVPPKPGRILPALLIFFALFGSLTYLIGTDDTSFLTSLQPGGNGWGRGGTKNAGNGLPQRPKLPHHPIDDLISDARLQFNQLMGKRSQSVEQAAHRYRERRGRHPPPGFDKWFEVARKKNCVIVEEFFDRIYHDINPFWGLEPRTIRSRAHQQEHVISVRNGRVKAVVDGGGEVPFRMKQWVDLVKKMMPYLPDLDMAVNFMDESRVMVPWDTIAEYVAAEERNRTLVPIGAATTKYGGVADIESDKGYDPDWQHGDTHRFWDYVRDACPPDSPGSKVSSLSNFNTTVEFPDGPNQEYTYKGFVRNFTASEDVCLQPHLRSMHGTFIEAISMSTTRELVPMFGESKLTTNNEMLIPSAMYLAERSRKEYSGGGARGGPWVKKKDGVMWRGSASGARNREETWRHNHRHRFIQMMNGTTVAAVEAGDRSAAPTFQLASPDNDPYNLFALRAGKLGEWVKSWSQVGFNDLLCFPSELNRKGKVLKTCKHNDAYMSPVPMMTFRRMYGYKYLPDIDGNSFSGRYRAFLMSSSLPLKSTIYPEWHDARLMPWVHFVPFDNTYMDFYGLMEYFLGGHDAEAERIATDGQVWSQAVLRPDDMLVYTWRLLLEYARVMDDNRDTLAYVEDLAR